MQFARGQRVLHIGCTDAPLTREKLAAGDLLHSKLLEVSAAVVGVDVDDEGLALLEEELGGRYAHVDATDHRALMPLLAQTRPTVIIAADVIEHVANPAQFVHALATCSRNVDPPGRVVVSTPNGLTARAPLLTFGGTEMIHPDHRVVYTPASLTRTLREGGLRPVEWTTYSISVGRSWPRRVFDIAARTASRARPFLADGLVVAAEVDTER